MDNGRLNRYDYEISKQISASDPPFYALLMALMRKADTDNLERIKSAWPVETKAFIQIYNYGFPLSWLTEEEEELGRRVK